MSEVGGSPRVTVGERILVHLDGYGRYAEAFECPVEMTQEGIARGLGISRAHAALELKRLRESGSIAERVAHVNRAKTRRKVYRLNPVGQRRAGEVKEFARRKPVTLLDGEERRQALGREVIDALKSLGLREFDAVQNVLVSDVVDLVDHRRTRKREEPEEPAFVGREGDLEALRPWVQGKGPPILVLWGIAGIGKTALARRLGRESGGPVVYRKVYRFEDARMFVAGLARQLQGVRRPRLARHLERGTFDAAEIVAILREDLAGCLLVLDDLHVSETAWELVRSVASGSFRGRILVASRTRPARSGRAGRVREHMVRGLPERDAASLLETRRKDLTQDEVLRAARAAKGHPLALVLYAASEIRSMPRTVDGLLRDIVLDGLAGEDEVGLRALAVCDRPVRILEGLGLTSAGVRRVTDSALATETEDGYVVHDLLRDFVLRTMSDRDRRRAHTTAAAYWEDQGESLDAARHHVESGDRVAAVRALLAADAEVAESPRATEVFELCRRLDDPDLALLEARAADFLGRWDAAESALRRGRQADPAAVALLRGKVLNKRGRFPEALRSFSLAFRRARGRQPDLRASALRGRAIVLRKLGRYPEAQAALTEASKAVRDSVEKHRIEVDRGTLLLELHRYEEAKVTMERFVRGDVSPRERAAALNTLAIARHRLGDSESAGAAFEESAKVSAAVGDLRMSAYALSNVADCLVALHRPRAARERCERANGIAENLGDPFLSSLVHANLALALRDLGDLDEAEAHARTSVDLLGPAASPERLRERWEILATIADARGHPARARRWRSRVPETQV